MLKKIRVIIAAFFIVAFTFLFLDFTGVAQRHFGWIAQIQFLPALLAGGVVIVGAWIAISLFFGRIYCSTICPLGVWQDVIAWKASWFRKKKKNSYGYRKPNRALVILRFVILGVFAIALILRIPFISTLLEPYSAYGRVMSQIFAPIYKYGNNILAGIAERAGSFAFAEVDIFVTSGVALAVAIITLLVISVCAIITGRGYCNTICPVGTLLAIVTKFSFIKQPIDKEKCNSCGLCAKSCKAGCIDPVAKEGDHLRCVSCCNCLYVCPKNAITFSLRNPFAANKNSQSSNTNTNANANAKNISADDNMSADGLARRNMITGAAILAVTSASSAIVRTYEFDGGLAPLEDKVSPPRTTPIIPPGAQNARNFRRRCTGCHLCVSGCPSNVLRPANDLQNFMQPQLTFERGYCRPECVRCSRLCPTGAILPITREDKSAIQIGVAVWNKDLCVVNADNVPCDMCSRRCPTGAITQISRDPNDESSLKIPMIDTARCTGCGACEYFCPSRPVSAIYVDGVESHRAI